MKTTLNLPDDLVQELKLRSVLERRKMKDVAAAALRRGLQAEPSPVMRSTEALPSSLQLNARGFPVIRCSPQACAATMTVDELLALEQRVLLEEDMHRAGHAR
jgi:plasmid stability protein